MNEFYIASKIDQVDEGSCSSKLGIVTTKKLAINCIKEWKEKNPIDILCLANSLYEMYFKIEHYKLSGNEFICMDREYIELSKEEKDHYKKLREEKNKAVDVNQWFKENEQRIIWVE